MKLELEILPGSYTIHRLDPDEQLPVQLESNRFWFAARTDREFSVVCLSEIQLNARVSDPGWRGVRITGRLDFDIVGVLAGLTGCLAAAGIPVFVVSTFETDYLLVKGDRFQSAINTLECAGYSVMQERL